MPAAWCAECGDEYAPVEYRPADVDGPNFCSCDCEELYLSVRAYEEARYAGAPAL